MPWPWWNVILLVTQAYYWQGNFSQEHLFLSYKLNQYQTAIKDAAKHNDKKKLLQSHGQKKLRNILTFVHSGQRNFYRPG